MMKTSKNRFEGKVALVTGGAKGIGAGIVQRLASEGAKVAFTYSSSAAAAHQIVEELEAAGGTALSIKADSASAEELQNAVAEATNSLGRLDIFVSNAGIILQGTVDQFATDDLDRMIAVNLRGAFLGIQAVSKNMNDGGRIIVIGSNAAVRSGFAGTSVYSMTKSALPGLVRGAAIDLAPRRITVNNIQPGPTATDMGSPYAEMLIPLIPLGRLGDAAEIAGFVAYLASEEAGFITGASLTIDGGYVA